LNTRGLITLQNKLWFGDAFYTSDNILRFSGKLNPTPISPGTSATPPQRTDLNLAAGKVTPSSNMVRALLTSGYLIHKSYEQPNLSLYTAQGLIILDSEGHRVMAKYWTPAHHPQPELVLKGLTTAKDQRTFEKGLWDKTRKSANGDSNLPCYLYCSYAS
jgi:hypothetical protein